MTLVYLIVSYFIFRFRFALNKLINGYSLKYKTIKYRIKDFLILFLNDQCIQLVSLKSQYPEPYSIDFYLNNLGINQEVIQIIVKYYYWF